MLEDSEEEIKPKFYRVSFYSRAITGGGEFEWSEISHSYGLLEAVERALVQADKQIKRKKMVQGFIWDGFSDLHTWQARRKKPGSAWSIEINPDSFYRPRWSWAVY
jgi:hypothetical protein